MLPPVRRGMYAACLTLNASCQLKTPTVLKTVGVCFLPNNVITVQGFDARANGQPGGKRKLNILLLLSCKKLCI
jgi:hypothetical protein